MQEMKARPPYVTFEQRPVRNAEKSEKEGMAVYEDTDYVIITPVGGKDTVEKEVSGWLEQCQKQVNEDRLPLEWLNHYRGTYEAWKKGKEVPLNGLSVKMWPIATPADVAHLIAANVLTVEDLAAANEQTLMRIGMGSRSLKQKAEAFLKSSDAGKLAEAFSKLEDSYAAAALRIEALEKENKELLSKLKDK